MRIAQAKHADWVRKAIKIFTELSKVLNSLNNGIGTLQLTSHLLADREARPNHCCIFTLKCIFYGNMLVNGKGNIAGAISCLKVIRNIYSAFAFGEKMKDWTPCVDLTITKGDFPIKSFSQYDAERDIRPITIYLLLQKVLENVLNPFGSSGCFLLFFFFCSAA